MYFLINYPKKKLYLFKAFLFLILFLFLAECVKFKKVDTRKTSTNAQERAKKNIKEGRGISIGKVLGKGSTNFEFTSSNPLWRSSLEILDFLPLSVVDYSGGVLITDWYNGDVDSKSSLKITLRFLSNEIRSDSLKIIVHEKTCTTNSACSTKILKSKISEELAASIIKKAAALEA